MIDAYGGQLVDRVVSSAEFQKLSSGVKDKIKLEAEDCINLINLATGVHSPLTGFMCEEEYYSVLFDRSLPQGLKWPLPIILSIPENLRLNACPDDLIGLEDNSGQLVGLIELHDCYRINRVEHAKYLYGTSDSSHPGVGLFVDKSSLCMGGKIYLSEAVLAKNRFFQTPRGIRAKLRKYSARSACAFSTRNICNLGHDYLHSIALELTDVLGINVITGPELSGTFKSDVVFDTYEYLIENCYPDEKVFLNNLRIPAIFAGPKEAFYQAIMLQNLGFSHFVVGRDHAGIGDYYGKYESQNILKGISDLKIEILAVSEPRYCRVCRKITTERSCRHKDEVEEINGRDIRQILQDGYSPGDVVKFVRLELMPLIEEIVCRNNHVDAESVLDGEGMGRLFYP